MSMIEIFVVYVITWLLVFFLALPFGNKWDESIETGLASSSPRDAKLGIKAIITTIIAGIISLIVYYILATSF